MTVIWSILKKLHIFIVGTHIGIMPLCFASETVDMRVKCTISSGHCSANLSKGELTIVCVGVIRLLGWCFGDMSSGWSVVDEETVRSNDIPWILVHPLGKKVVQVG